ncbi:MAG: CapA family protein [Sulfuricella sp.]|nr:CapA family protein [Sulfuricella sp.]
MSAVRFLGRLLLLAVLAAPVVAQQRVSLVFVGDIMLDTLPGKAIAQGRDPFAPFAAQFAAADLRIGNLECVVANGGEVTEKIYTFRAHPRTLVVLKRHFDAVSLANNHSGDFGRAAFSEMLGHLDRQGIGYFGGGRDLRQAHAPLIVERHGLRIALLGYNEFLPRSFEADYDAPGIAWSEDEQVREDLRQARAIHHADIVIPYLHGGWEYEPRAGARQRQLARLLIDAGADAVIGGHPHVTQDTEVYRGKPIIYSLGNFLIDGFEEPATTTGWLLRLELDQDGVTSWHTVIARLDGEGIPHPDLKTPSPCWKKGENAAAMCGGK